MGARFVPIQISVSGGSQGAAEVGRLSASFNQLDSAANKAGGGGLRSAFNASNLVRTELQSLASQIPIVGRFFNAGTADLLAYAKAGQQVTAEMKQRKQAFQEFVKLIGDFTPGLRAGESLNIFGTLGKFDVSGGMLRDKEKAFGDFVKAFQAIEDPAQRAAVATAQFGAKGEALLPILESMTAEEAAIATQTGAVGGSMLALLGPIALVVAAVAVLTAGIVLGGKAMFDLTKLAADTGGEVHDLSQKINFTAETISTLSVAGKTAGVDIGALSSALGIFDKNITQAYESDTKLAKQFRDFNIDVSNNEKALRQVFQALAALPPGAKQTELAMLAFGRSGKEVLGIVKETNGDIDETMVRLQRLGLILSTEDAKAADQFSDKLDLLSAKIKMIGVRIGFELMPYVERLVDGFDRLVNQKGPEIIRWAQQTIESAKNVAAAIKGIESAILVTANLSGTSVADSDGTWLMSNVLRWSTGAGVAIEGLKAIWGWLDKIGSKLRENQQAPAPTGSRPLTGDEAKRISERFLGIGAAQKAGLDNLLPSQQEVVDKLLSSSKQRLEEASAAAQNFGDKTHEAALREKILRDKTLELPPALEQYRAAIQAQIDANNRAALAEARRFDQMAAQKKQADEAAKQAEKLAQANLNFGNETEGLRQRLSDLTGTQSKARTEVEKFNEALAGGKYKDVGQDQLNARLKVLREIDSSVARINKQQDLDRLTESAKRAANSIAEIGFDVAHLGANAAQETPLDRVADRIAHISDLKIDPAKFQPIIELFRSAPEAVDLSKAFDQFWSILDKEVQDNTASKQIAMLVGYLFQAAQASRELAAAQTPLAQAQREYNDLIKDERELHDPVLVQQRIANELLRDKIDLESRDLGAVVSLARSQREMADAMVYHSAQANASVAEFLAQQKSITEIVADAKTGVIQTTFDYLDRGLASANRHLGRMGDLLTQIESDFIKLAATKFFQWLFGAGSTGGGGGIGASVLGGLFGGGSFSNGGNAVTGGFAGGAGAGQYLNSSALFNLIRNGGNAGHYSSGLQFLKNFDNEGITAPTSTLSGGGGSSAVLHEAGHTGATATLGGGLSLGGFKTGAAGMLPLLGLGLGSSLGGQSRLGTIVGGAGGLLAGGIGTALLAPSLFGIGTAGGSSTFMAGMYGFLTNPFTAVAAGALIVGAILLARNKQRRIDETKRAELSGNVYNDTIQILNAARSGQIGYSEAMSQYGQVRTNYFAQVAQMKDAKTKRIATDWWNRDFDPVYRPAIEKAARASDEAKARAGKLNPEFADGGSVSHALATMQTMRHLRFADGGAMAMFNGRVPGVYDRRDNNLIAVSGDEVVLTPRQWKPITNYLKAVRVPGFADGGTGAKASPSIGGGDEPFTIELHLTNKVVVSDSDSEEIVATGIIRPSGKKAAVKVFRSEQRSAGY